MLSVDNEQLFSRILKLNADFQMARGFTGPADSSEIYKLAYSLPVERGRISLLQESRPEGWEDLLDRQDEVRINIVTLLGERLQVEMTFDDLNIINGRLYSPRFKEPLGEVLARGVELRRKVGSPDGEREVAELEGWKFIEKTMVNPATPIGTKIISLSAPSDQPGSPYKKRFIDEFMVAVNESGQRSVLRIRNNVNFDTNNYINFAQKMDPDFFEEYSGQPLDAYLLSHPKISREEVPPSARQGMSVEKFNRIMEATAYFRERHLHELFAAEKDFDWGRVIQTHNELINATDKLTAPSVKQPVSYLPSQEVLLAINLSKQVIGGCGLSGIFEINQKGNQVATQNSVAQFGEQSSWEYHTGECVVCKTKNVSVGPCSICTSCEKNF